MQSFRLSKDAKKWFKNIMTKRAFDMDFDVFYFCFVAGIVANRQRDLKQDETSEITDYFPGAYGDRSRVLVGMLLKAKLDAIGISLSERAQVHRCINRYIATNSPSHMSAEGVREFCKYSHGGFEVLQEWFGSEPVKLETFLRNYKNWIDEACRKK